MREKAASQSQRYTFRGNLRASRHAWLRLTPAYSLHVVRELLDERSPSRLPVLDPFCGTGTTALACAELGVDCHTIELNPFLVWLARAKVRTYSTRDLDEAERALAKMTRAARGTRPVKPWVPALHNIERWWEADTLAALGRAFGALRDLTGPGSDIARLAFCRALIQTSNASFRHQSMSFQKGRTAPAPLVADALTEAFSPISKAAREGLPARKQRVFPGDSRNAGTLLGKRRYSTLITSPPYANRMSYIRELRPYMYWLGFLDDARSAGNLDWDAIGGTWGIATSNLMSWKPPASRLALRGFAELVARIHAESPLLARYVERYAHDMARHLASVARVIAPGGSVHYIVGNSKFYGVVVPVEKLFAAELRALGFERVKVEMLRKRTSKPELFEFAVSGQKP
jgi:hypothetical protein